MSSLPLSFFHLVLVASLEHFGMMTSNLIGGMAMECKYFCGIDNQEV